MSPNLFELSSAVRRYLEDFFSTCRFLSPTLCSLSADYVITNLLSDLAGVLGITLGASVVTMLELCVGTASLCAHLLGRGRVSLL